MLTVEDLKLKGKTVFLRVDFNVPLDKNGQIRDDTRIRAALPTLQYLLNKKAKVVLASHFGRPKGNYDPNFSLQPVASRLAELIPQQVTLAPDVVGKEVEKLKMGLTEDHVLLLENVRFWSGETENDPDFSQKLAQGIDCYVNDAFGACHRAHASVVGITRYVDKAAAGFLVKKEVEYLKKVILSPKKPCTAILGGAKVSDKIPVIESLLTKADQILIGGAMAYTFFAAQGYGVGCSLVEPDKEVLALSLLKKAAETGVTIGLPEDHVAASSISEEAEACTIESFPIPAELMALDIGPKTIATYSGIISRSKTIFWNGPLGVFEIDKFSKGTTRIAEAVASSSALSIVGGGDSVAAVYKAGVTNKISHISTGGGASLEFIAKGTLPGLEALSEK